MQRRTTWPILIGAALALIGCQPPPAHQAIEAVFDQPEPAARDATPSSTSPDPCSFALAPHSGESRVDREIIRLQQEIQRASNPAAMLERLGWMFVAKARASFDPGFYTLAEQCALCLESNQPDSAESLLLRGHVLHNLHRFRAAEPLARRLVAQRGLAVDFGLLGDLLMEQGRLAEAVEAYQAMIDRKPDPQAYARVAHVRWLKGDLAGATEMMQMAAGAAGPNSPETAAWFQTRLAFYRFQGGAMTEAGQACAGALEYQQDFAPALLLRGRMLLSAGEHSPAVETLRRAAELNPLPEYQWALAEALRAAGRADEAGVVEAQLHRHAAASDPRTYALYLATRGESAETALRLATQELADRGDVFTHDALAWALVAAGRLDEAQRQMERALVEGTRDARLFFHATVIAAKCGRADEAQRWFDQAAGLFDLLLPSEQRQLISALAGGDNPLAASSVPGDFSAPGH